MRRHRADRRVRDGAASRRLGNPLPRQCLAPARAHDQPLHPVPHAGRPRGASGRRRRRRQRGQEPHRSPPRRHRDVQGARRHRPRRVCDLSDASDRACRDRLDDRACSPAPRCPSSSSACSASCCRCRSCRRCIADELALSLVYGLLTALAFGLWPLGRVHDVPVAALFRETVDRRMASPALALSALMAVVIALLIAVVIGLAYDKRVAAVFVVSSIAVFVAAARHRRRPDGAGAPVAADPHHHAAARDRQYLPARRVDAVGRDVARPRSRRAGHDHPDRRQSAAAIHGGVARSRAVVLFHRHSHQPKPTASAPS